MAVKKNLLIDKDINYSKPSVGRTFYLDVDGQRIRATKDIYSILKKSKWNEIKQKELKHRHIKFSEHFNNVRCKKDCTNCPFYMTKIENKGVMSIDKLYEEYEYKVGSENDSPDECLFSLYVKINININKQIMSLIEMTTISKRMKKFLYKVFFVDEKSHPTDNIREIIIWKILVPVIVGILSGVLSGIILYLIT